MQGFLLGLASGSACLAYCAPALLPYLLGEGKSSKQNLYVLGQFLTGRLLGYLLFAFLAYGIGSALSLSSFNRELLLGPAYILLSIILCLYAVTPQTKCASHALGGLVSKVTAEHPALIPSLMGLLTGINLCPPFLLAFADAAGATTLPQSLFYFLTFFMGTAVYFLPLPLLGSLQNFPSLRTVGKMAAVLMSFYYLYTGIILSIGGISTL